MEDVNTEVTQMSIKVSCDCYEFKNLIKGAACYKIPENPICIDLILANNHNSFQNLGLIETGLSGLHKTTITVMKTTIEKLKPNIYITETIEIFLMINLGNIFFPNHQLNILELNVMTWRGFCKYVLVIWMNFHLKRKKCTRESNMTFKNKTIKNAFVKRSHMRNIYLKNYSNNNKRAYNKQKNYWKLLLRKKGTVKETSTKKVLMVINNFVKP